MVDANALARLVGDAAGFLATSFGRQPVHVAVTDRHGGPADLLSLADVDALVTSTGLRAPAFRLVKQGRTLRQSDVTRRVRIGSRPVTDLIDVPAVHRAVSDGATLVLQGLHRSFPPVEAFCRDLAATLTHPVQANAYLTPPVAQGLDLHEDPHDVFAVQTYGTKRWVVHPPGPDGAAGEVWDLELRPGDVLYLPAGTRHAAQTVGTPSLHLTLGVRTVTWRAVLRRAVDQVLAEQDGLDRPLPAGWADEPGLLSGELGGRLADLAGALRRSSGTDAVEAEARAFRRSRVPDMAGSLRDLLELETIDDRTRLRRRDDAPARVVERGGRVELVLRDRTVRFPIAVAPAVRRLIAGPLRPMDLEEHLDEAGRLVLCRRAVREGLLAVVRERDGAEGG